MEKRTKRREKCKIEEKKNRKRDTMKKPRDKRQERRQKGGEDTHEGEDGG